MKHWKTRITLTAGGVALSSAALLWAAPEGAHFPISVEAIEARGAEVFARGDADGDGMITPAEFAAQAPGRDGHGKHGARRHGPGHPPPHARAHGDLDPAEREAHLERMRTHRAAMDAALFDALDGDGALDRAEFSSEAIAAARRSMMQENRFARLDGNEDGVLTPDEFPPRRIGGLDADGDGEITRDELRSAHRNRPPEGPRG